MKKQLAILALALGFSTSALAQEDVADNTVVAQLWEPDMISRTIPAAGESALETLELYWQATTIDLRRRVERKLEVALNRVF